MIPDTAPPILDVFGQMNSHSENIELVRDHAIIEIEEGDE
jgi:hypothetical protein